MNPYIFRAMACAIVGALLGWALLGPAPARAQTTHCTSQACFAEQFQQCQPATLDTPAAMGAQGRYTIKGAQADGCRVAFVFTQNPNPEWVNKPVGFVLDTSLPLDGQLKAAVAACLMGADSTGDFACQAVDSAAAPALSGSVTLAVNGDPQTLGWSRDALVIQEKDFHIVVMGGVNYRVESDNGHFKVVDAHARRARDRSNNDAAVQFEDTGKTETIAGITGHVFKATAPASNHPSRSYLLTLTADPRVVAVGHSLSSMFPDFKRITQALPAAYPGLLNIPGDDARSIPKFVSFSDQAPDYFEPAVQAVRTYLAERAE